MVSGEFKNFFMLLLLQKIMATEGTEHTEETGCVERSLEPVSSVL